MWGLVEVYRVERPNRSCVVPDACILLSDLRGFSRLTLRQELFRFPFAVHVLWLLGGRTFGGSRGGYCCFLIFEIVCQISLTPRPSMAENAIGF